MDLFLCKGVAVETEKKIHIIGIGDDGLEGLTPAASELIRSAELVIGTNSVIGNLDSSAVIEVDGSLDDIVAKLADNQGKKTVLLADGDPLFYGVARYLCDSLGKDRFEVLPHVSSMQLAFARVKESWDDAFLANLATQPISRIIEKARVAEKVGLFTIESCKPNDVAKTLLENQIDYFSAYVCENLGSRDECVTQGELSDIASQEFGALNVMILVRKPNIPDRTVQEIGKRLFGNRDDLFQQSKPKRGLLTPMEVRVIALAELDLGPRSVVWDIGAGSGAVAIEAARIAREGSVYAIEMDADDHQLLVANAEAFNVGSQLVPVLGKAPEAWKDLPEPDAVFVGGTGRAVGSIVEQAIQRLKPGGRLVANVNSVENLYAVQQRGADAQCEVEVRMINLAHSTDQIDQVRFEAMNPTFLVSMTNSV